MTTPNITQDPSGIPHYDEAIFIKTIHEGKLVAKELNPIMPWGYFRGMKDDDLRAIFAYLKTVPHATHRVDNRELPTYCKICKGRHGLGDKNY